MDLLANIPSWDDIERNLDQRFNELNQGVNDSLHSANNAWEGFNRRIHTSANHAYGYFGGHRIDNVRQAMALSYPIIQADLKRKWASIDIEQILPVLLQLVKEVSMILGSSVAVGTVAGGAAGAFAFGVGAAPGAVAGAGIGLQIGNVILIGLGLSAIAEYFHQGLPACLSTLMNGLATAWHAEDGLVPSGLDPTGGSAVQVQEGTERAARQLARGQEQLVLLLLTAIVTYITRGQVKAGVMNSVESIATRSAKLRAELSNKQLAAWLAKNEQKLLIHTELQLRDPAPILWKEKPPPETLREYYARQDPDFISHEDLIKQVKTFQTHGVPEAEAILYLKTPDGQKLLEKLADASPDAAPEVLLRRALDQIGSGAGIPELKLISSPLIKIVPEGSTVSPYSPFFTTLEEIKAAISRGSSLADSFGLPLSSEATRYSMYQITPLRPTEVFVAPVASTSELGGSIVRSGGALQYLTPNRGEWAAPKLISTVSN